MPEKKEPIAAAFVKIVPELDSEAFENMVAEQLAQNLSSVSPSFNIPI